MEESEIKAIKLILAVLALGLLVAVGAAFEDYGGSHHHGGPSDGYHDFGGFYDWLSPGAYYYSYSYYPTYTYYPTYYYPTYYYPTYTPVYTYTLPLWSTILWSMIPGGQQMSTGWALPHTTTRTAGPGRHIAADSTSAEA